MVTEEELARAAVEADLASARYRAGVLRGQWRTVMFDFPFLVVAVPVAPEISGEAEIEFRFELSGFKRVAPSVQLWDSRANAALPRTRQPSGSARVIEAFKPWQEPATVYRAWDRFAMAHGNWEQNYPTLKWHSDRDLTFILEDLYGLLVPVGTPLGTRVVAQTSV
jgi:hypothetical protein